MKRIPTWLIVLILGSALVLPMLGSYGLWDPIEIKHADVARDLSESGNFTDVTVGGKYSPRPVMYVWLLAAGFKLLGVNEFAGRFPLALCSILTLLLLLRVGTRLASTRVGLLSVFVLGTTPTFIFQSRLLVSEMPFYLALLAAVGGLAAFIWPADGKRCRWDLIIGGLGLVAGYLSRGLILGSMFPLVGIAAAVALSWRTRRAPHLSAEPQQADRPYREDPAEVPGESVAEVVKANLVPLAVTVGLAALAIGLLSAVLEQSTFMIFGAEYRRTPLPPTFETTLKKLGFSFFPWFALIPLFAGLTVASQREDAGRRPPEAFAQILVLVLIVLAYVVGSLWMGFFGKLNFIALPLLALGTGLLVHHVMVHQQSIHRLWGLIAVGPIIAIQQDYFMDPQSLPFSHLMDLAKYPVELEIKVMVRIFGLSLAALFFLCLGGTPRAINRKFSGGFWGSMGRNLSFVVDELGHGVRFLGGPGNRNFFIAAGATALIFAGWCGFYLLPNLSLHLSNKALFETFHTCKAGNEKLAQYQVSGRGAAYYNNGKITQIGNQRELFKLLRAPERAFVLLPAKNLASIDQATRQAKISYHVLDDRNSQFLIVSNKLGNGCERDRNPLRKYVLPTAPSPKHKITANFENKVELLGYDVPEKVRLGTKFKISLYFKVLSRMPAGYKIFIHFDQPAHRFHGDHEPLDGKLPTQYWFPGDYIEDPYVVETSQLTGSSGPYTIYMGFWRGESRIKVIKGPNDGVNRVRIGTLNVTRF